MPLTTALLMMLLCGTAAVQARTVYRCVRDGTVSLATAPEPGSRCVPKHIDDNAVKVPNLWGALGVINGTLYEREQDGATVYSTRKLPGSTPVLSFTVETPPGEPAHAGLGNLGTPQPRRVAPQCRAAAEKHRDEDGRRRANRSWRCSRPDITPTRLSA